MTVKTRIFSIVFFAISFVGFAQSNCKDLRACERKLCELNTKLTAASKAGNINQVKSIENAISKTERNCTTKSVNKDLDKKVKEKQHKVVEKTADLNKTIAEQQSKEKIDKKTTKLNEAKAELKQALDEQKTK